MSTEKKTTVTIDTIEAAASTLAIANHTINKDINICVFKAEAKTQLTEQTESLQNGNLSQVEAILYAQAMVLDNIFNRNIMLHAVSKNLKEMQATSQIAFKAQKQCRATLATLAEIKRPNRTIFVRQQNNAFNQQVNCAKSEPSKINQANELLSEVKHETLDFKGTKEAIKIDSQMEALEPIDGSENF